MDKVKKENRLPREVWVAGISLKGLWPVPTIEKRMKDILERMENVYITCPIITKKDGHFYNSSILLNRQGKTEGVFHKVHPVSTEIIPNEDYKNEGVTPGPIKPPVYKTDFGNVGMQICFDANWTESWHSLKEDGAELVCFPSQGPFTHVLRNHAWMNHYAIVSATGEDAQIIDMT